MQYYEVTNVRKITIGGQKRIAFRLWRNTTEGKVFAGCHFAPDGTRKNKLIDFCKPSEAA